MEKLKGIGEVILGIGGFLLLVLMGALLLNGTVWVGEHVIQWLMDLGWWVLAIDLFILLPFGLFRKTGMFGGLAMYYSSFVFGLTLWFLGLLLTYFAWGFLGVIIGLVIFGVGVVPVAMLAMLLHGEFFSLLVLVVLTVLTFGSRALGIYLAARAEEKNEIAKLEKLEFHEQ